MKTGVCYYPEHWPEEQWATDAAHMRRLGLSVVRVGEFAWSRLESCDGTLNLDWLERAIDTLHSAGLSIVMCTPTATPPRWILDKHPDICALDADGKPRGFGSRRHYCFSAENYLDECRRIVTILGQRFGEHPGIAAWQIDNEYGCHSTTISYSLHALHAFRRWCAARYTTIAELNRAWGNVFWSMEYDTFEHIGLPVGTVTESNPSHQLAYWRFSSDQVTRFNKVQVDILRRLAPGCDILHNFMGNFVEFDHHAVSRDLDIATWDNYPLGFLTRDFTDPEIQAHYLRTGHPDGSAFHHDLYRGCCNGRWWVMEQQPGPVNWAPYNPSPLPGMVRLWGWEAFAHGAEVMSYFRWRQAPFAQEQTHTGLLLPDSSEDIASAEIARLNRELALLKENPEVTARDVVAEVAIVFSYAGIAIQDIQSPGGDSYSALTFCQRVYSACRQFGVNIDIVSSNASLDRYKLIICCTSTEDDTEFAAKLSRVLADTQASLVLFPGTGSRSAEFAIPAKLAPGNFQSLIGTQVVRSESLPRFEKPVASDAAGTSRCCTQWRERISATIAPKMHFSDGWGFHFAQNRVHYINAIPEQPDLVAIMGELLGEAGIAAHNLGPDVRTQRIGPYRLAFNFGAEPVDLVKKLGDAFDLHQDTALLAGNRVLNTADIAVWLVG